MRIALAYNLKRSEPSLDPKKQVDLEFDSPNVTQGQKEAIESLGHTVYLVEADENAFLKLKKLKGKIDLVFNVAEGLWGDARESQIPIFCEVLKIPYTHSSPTTHTITLDKSFTKLILGGADHINVPDSHVISGKSYSIPKRLKFPLIIKPNKEGSSKGVMDANVVWDRKDLDKRVKATLGDFAKEVLVEQFIEGREFTVAVMGNRELQVLPIIEQKFGFLPKGMNKIASFELKWIYEDSLKDVSVAYECPARLATGEKDLVEGTSKKIYKLLDVRDCARIDYRMDKNGKLYFLEINTLPGMIPPGENVLSYFPLAAYTAGMSYKDLIAKILSLACERYGLKN